MEENARFSAPSPVKSRQLEGTERNYRNFSCRDFTGARAVKNCYRRLFLPYFFSFPQLNPIFSANSETNRIALFYIMNDAVQKAKNKHFDYLIAAFQPAVLSAITVARTATKVKKIMQRCIEIFREREVFTNASVTAMFNILREF